jgi:hypothetical protein
MATKRTTEFTPVPGSIVEKEGPGSAGAALPRSRGTIARVAQPGSKGWGSSQPDGNYSTDNGTALTSGIPAEDNFNHAGGDGEAPPLQPGAGYTYQTPQSQNEDASPTAQIVAAIGAGLFGPNNERLDELKPRVVTALRDLMLQFRSEGLVARRSEVRRIKQARLFWQGLQYAWWNPGDMSWHVPFVNGADDPAAAGLEEMPRYQFVTNLYQAFGLSFIALVSQDTPATRFYPQSAQSDIDVLTARAASDVAALVEQNNKVQQLLTGVGYYLWTDGKIGGYVRYVSDAQRFGWHDEDIVEEALVRLGEDAYVCPVCGHESPADAAGAVAADASASEGDAAQGSGSPKHSHVGNYDPIAHSGKTPDAKRASGYPSAENRPQDDESIFSGSSQYVPQDDENILGGAPPLAVIPRRFAAEGYPDEQYPSGVSDNTGTAAAQSANFLAGALCPQCGAALSAENFRRAPVVAIPRVTGVRRVPNGQEVISILGGLELNTPVWANEMHEFPYLQWQQEVHLAKLRAAYPHAADKIILGGPVEAEDVYARASRVAVAQGLPTTQPGDALYNLITFTRTWIRPWAFYAIDDKQTREELLALFPGGAYVAFAGETYCESRNETLDDHWRVMHALPGDGQNRPSVGDSLVQIQERYNTLSNIQAETYEFGIPPIYADPQVLDFDALSSQTAEPAAHYPARAKPGQPLAASFFQPAPAQVPADMLEHQQELAGPVAQFLTGLFPAVFGGTQGGAGKTASGYAMARDQAMGRLGLVWRRLKQFYADLMLLGVDTFRQNRPQDVEIPLLGASGEFESKWIRLADLKGNIQAHPEADETFPSSKAQQRSVLQSLLASNDPLITQALSDPDNIAFIKGVFGLDELAVPGEDSREKQLREISQLLAGAPIVVPASGFGCHPEGIRPRMPEGSVCEHHRDVANGTADDDSSHRSLPAGRHGFVAQNAPQDDNVGMGAPNSSSRAFASNSAAPPPAASVDRSARALSSPEAPASGPTLPAQHFIELPSVPIDELLDDHAAELAEIRRWASSDAGQIARAQNPLGFANVRAHAAAHQSALARQSAQAAIQQAANASLTGRRK